MPEWLSAVPVLRRRRSSAPAARPAPVVLGGLPSGWRVEAAVPFDHDGLHWLLACRQGLVCAVVDEEGRQSDGVLGAVTGWDEITSAAWDAEARSMTLKVTGRGEPVVVTIPAYLRRDLGQGRSEELEVDERTFSRVLRAQVERAIVHYASRTIAGVRVTASVRRRADSSLYLACEPAMSSPALVAHQAEVVELLRGVAADVGLPTGGDFAGMAPIAGGDADSTPQG